MIPTDYSMDPCVAKEPPIGIDDTQVKPRMILGGRCAVLPHCPGDTNNNEPTALHLCRDRLPASGEEARGFPLYRQRKLALVPRTSAHKVIAELFLPLK